MLCIPGSRGKNVNQEQMNVATDINKWMIIETTRIIKRLTEETVKKYPLYISVRT